MSKVQLVDGMVVYHVICRRACKYGGPTVVGMDGDTAFMAVCKTRASAEKLAEEYTAIYKEKGWEGATYSVQEAHLQFWE